MINSWPGPENSCEGVDAYFTWADKPGMLVFLTLVTACICLAIVISAARHEADTASKNQ